MTLFKPTMSGRTALVVVIVVATGLGVAGFRQILKPANEISSGESAQSPQLTPLPLPPERDTSYVGSSACADCHADISGHWKNHPMGKSACRLDTGSNIEDYDPDLRVRVSLDLTYAVRRNEEGAVHDEICTGLLGDVVYEQPVTMHYAVGSGQRGRSYVRLVEGGFLYQSPLSWYSTPKTWGLSPGFTADRRHSRRISDECLQCHTGRMYPVGDRSPEHVFQEHAIGCERCHGPGKAHVEFYHSHKAGQKTDGPKMIVNPVKLDPAYRDSVCFQCHLQGGKRVLRYGRTEWDFRPGDHLNDIWVVFVQSVTEVDKTGMTEAVSQASQYIRSRCYQESNGRMTCTSCHDPHRLVEPNERVEWYRARCAECHNDGGTHCPIPVEDREKENDNSCIACHMPALSASDVPHLAQTDHRVLRDPAAVGAPAAADRPYRVFDEHVVEIPELELRRAWVLHKAELAIRDSDFVVVEELLPECRELVSAQQNDVALLMAWGRLLHALGKFKDARDVFLRVTQIDPQHEPALRELASVSDDITDSVGALEYLERLVEINRWDSDVREQYVQTLIDLGRHAEATEAAIRSLKMDPRSVLLHSWLVDYFDSIGQPDRSENHLRITTKLRDIQERYATP